MNILKHHFKTPRWRKLVILLAVAQLFCSCPAYAQEALWRSYYTSAQIEYQHGNFVEARNLLNSALGAACQPDESLSTYYYLAHICTKTQDFAEAERSYKTVLDGLGIKAWAVLRPPDGTPDWEQNAAETETTRDGPQFRAILNKKPPRLLTMKLAKPITIVDVLADYGNMLQVQGRNIEAEAAYRQALILSDCRPDHALNYQVTLLQRLAILFDAEGKAGDSKAVSKQLMLARNAFLPDFDALVNGAVQGLDKWRRNPHQLAIRMNNLALFCASHGDYARAQTLFNRALSCLSEHQNAHKRDRALVMNNYSDLLLAMGRVSEAQGLSRQALSLLPSLDVQPAPLPSSVVLSPPQ